MKKFILIGLSLLIAGPVCSQIPDGTLDKSQQRKVRQINKQIQKQHSDILKDPAMSAEEKISRIQSSRNEREKKFADFLTPEQISAVEANDLVDFDKAVKKVSKKEKTRLKTEKDHQLHDISQQQKVLDKQSDDVKRLMEDMKKKQADIKAQQKALKQKRKNVNVQYK